MDRATEIKYLRNRYKILMAQRKRKVITFGGLQSNHARMTAAACAQLCATVAAAMVA